MTLKEKLSRKGHFIDVSNEYNFIYVPGTISSEKKIFLTSAGVNFFPRKLSTALRLVLSDVMTYVAKIYQIGLYMLC